MEERIDRAYLRGLGNLIHSINFPFRVMSQVMIYFKNFKFEFMSGIEKWRFSEKAVGKITEFRYCT